MSIVQTRIHVIIDDREFTAGEVRSVVGARRYCDISLKRRSLIDHLRSALPEWVLPQAYHVRTQSDLESLRERLVASGEKAAVFVLAGRAAFLQPAHLTQLIERLPYAEEDFTDRMYKPLLVFMREAHRLVEQWPQLEKKPLHLWETPWANVQRLESVLPLDLSTIADFLTFTSGATAVRHFNEMEIDGYYYTKRSTDKRKMLAEYSFYKLVPESMRPWLVQTFDYQDDGERASYKMMRYYLPDAAIQWVHGAFGPESFSSFIDRLLFFLSQRPQRSCSLAESMRQARILFVEKLQERTDALLNDAEGRRVNTLVASSDPALDVGRQVERYLRLYAKYEESFAMDHASIGHGDPCFSNILYDQQRYLLKLIDPKGACDESALWTHPLYDLCKISHSLMGDYDFINNGRYRIDFTDDNKLSLVVHHSNHQALKVAFMQKVKSMGYKTHIMRLGEASLFLSMLPLHIDYPNKVMAFMLRANQILDEVELGNDSWR